MKIGIIREGKTPPDLRSPLTPLQCVELMQHFPETEIVVQPSEFRCFKNSDFEKVDISINENISDCDILLGIKEVPSEELIANKTYLFFRINWPMLLLELLKFGRLRLR